MLVVDKPRYKMAIYENRKEVHVQIIGFIRDEVVPEYVKDLQDLVKMVPGHQYTFVVDATYQSPLPSKTAANLGETMMVYSTFGFKEIFVVYPKSKISYVQVRNALATVNFPGTLVDDVSQLPSKFK